MSICTLKTHKSEFFAIQGMDIETTFMSFPEWPYLPAH